MLFLSQLGQKVHVPHHHPFAAPKMGPHVGALLLLTCCWHRSATCLKKIVMSTEILTCAFEHAAPSTADGIQKHSRMPIASPKSGTI